MTYPVHTAEEVVERLDGRIARLGGNVFIGPLGPSAHGEEYRNIKIDVTRQEWNRVKQVAFKEGWKPFGNDALLHELPEGFFVIAHASF